MDSSSKFLIINVDGEDNVITLNVKGSNKAIKIDINKLKEAITVIDTQVDEEYKTCEEMQKWVGDTKVAAKN